MAFSKKMMMCEFKLIESYVLESSSGVFEALNSAKHYDVTSNRTLQCEKNQMIIIELGFFSNRLKTISEDLEWNSEEVLNYRLIFHVLDGAREHFDIENLKTSFSFVLAGHALAGKMHYIIGGNDVTDRAEYPYVVSLQYLSTHVHFCGGSIINSHWVISAAHCHMIRGYELRSIWKVNPYYV